MTSLLVRAALAPVLALTACTGTRPSPTADFNWTLGTWNGARRDVARGTEASMSMRVEPLFGATGQLRTLSIESSSGASYWGTAVQLFDHGSGRWSWQYTNSPERAFARYIGPGAVGRPVLLSEWRSVKRGERTSRLLSQRLEDGRWRRTMQRSADGGRSWRSLWVDTLRPDDGSPR